MRALTGKLCVTGATAAIAVAILPPLSGVADQLFSAHMVQHLLLIAVAAPLLAASGVFADRFPAHPVAAWLAFVCIFLFWHWPVAFRWAAAREITQLVEFTTILFSAFLFWRVALSDRGVLSSGARALFVMTAAIATDLPGVIMVFSPQAICTMPGENALHWGLSPLEDQQIAGLLMWVPANLIFFAVATWLFARWISDTSTHHLVTP